MVEISNIMPLVMYVDFVCPIVVCFCHKHQLEVYFVEVENDVGEALGSAADEVQRNYQSQQRTDTADDE